VFFPSVQSSETSTTAQQNCLSEQPNELSQNIADLSNKQLSLHNSIQAVYCQHGHWCPRSTLRAGPTSNALNIIDKMADRDRRKK